MRWPHTEPFHLSTHDEARVVEAIRRAEQNNRGEVRVHIESTCAQGQSLTRARELFFSLGMEHTREATGVLLYAAPRSRTGAVYAGPGITRKVEAGVWQAVISYLSVAAGKGDLVGGIEAALNQIGVLLRRYLPGIDVSGDELPNKVTTTP